MASGGALAAGDVTWHHGWTLHSAPPLLLPEEFHEVFGSTEEGPGGEDDADGFGGGFRGGSSGLGLAAEVKSRLAFTVSFIADGALGRGPFCE